MSYHRIRDSLHRVQIMSLVLCVPHREVTIMGLENTITELDLDPATQQFIQGLRNDSGEFEPDLAVDGLSESVISRFVRLIAFRRS